MPDFCTGSGVAMGSDGLKLDGVNSRDDCVMLWTTSLDLSSSFRMAVACFFVFCIAVLAQFLGTTNSNRLRSAKKLAQTLYQNSQRSNSIRDDTQVMRRGSRDDSDNVSAFNHDSPSMYNTISNSTASGSVDGIDSSGAVLQKAGNLMHLKDSFLHGLRIFVAYLLMLVVMTYSVNLIASIVFGFATGYYVFTGDSAKVPISADPCCASD